MEILTVTPRPEIAPFIHHFWVFRSPTGLPCADARVVVPNGRAKLVVPWRNGLTATGAGRTSHHREGEALVIGLWEDPSVIASTAEPTDTIGVEFLPHGLHRFFPGPLDALTGAIAPIDAYLGLGGARLARRVMQSETLAEAVDVVQAFLVAQLRGRDAAATTPVDHALRLMAASGYRMDMKELERRIGYSRRHLQTLFREQVGLTPKRLSGVLVFERLYRSFAAHRSPERLQEEALEVFYDQSHFIHAFRRFTGLAPTRYAELDNGFSRLFYQEG